MLTFNNHLENANQNLNEISPHTCQNGYHPKEHKQQMLARTWEKANLVTLLAGMYFGAATVENKKEITKKIKIELAYDPAIPLLGVYQKNKQTTSSKRQMHSTVHSGIIYNCQGMKTT